MLSLYSNYAAAKAATALADRFSVGLHKDTHTVTHTNIHAHIFFQCVKIEQLVYRSVNLLRKVDVVQICIFPLTSIEYLSKSDRFIHLFSTSIHFL